MVVGSSLFLDHVIRMILDHMRENSIDNVEDSTSAILSQNPHWVGVALKAPLTGDAEEIMFTTIVSCNRMKRLNLSRSMDADSAETLLRKAIPLMPNLKQVSIEHEMTKAQAETIFSMLSTIPTLQVLHISFGSSPAGIAIPLANFLRGSRSLAHLAMSWQLGEWNPTVTVPEASFRSICDEIAQCRTLTSIAVVNPPPTADTERFAGLLSLSISNSSSISRVHLFKIRDFARHFRNALLQTPRVQSFDMLLKKKKEDALFEILELERNMTPWRRLLSQNVLLSMWPRILAKTNTWTKYDSHTPADALFFLLKEKKDVLLQNVHCRKIRKRKRYLISS